MAPNGCLAKGADPSLLRGTRRVRGKGKPRYKFGKDAVLMLQQCFEKNPYPDYTTREEIAKTTGCPLHILQNWFQNKRARLLPEEKKTLFANRKRRRDLPEQNDPPAGLQDTQIQMPTNTSGLASYAQWILPGSVVQPAVEIQDPLCEAYGPHDLMATDRSPSFPLLNEANIERGCSPSSVPMEFLQSSFGQYCAQGLDAMGESGPAMSYLFDYYYRM